MIIIKNEAQIMLRKIMLSIIGFAFGAFMLVNGIGAFYRFLYGYRLLTPSEWMFSSIVTFSVGIVLIIWTLLLIKKRG